MELKELTKDLFDLPETYLLAHCISSDARMGRGIAVAFCKNFDLASLQASTKETPLEIGRCYREGRVLNLVTKQKYSGKPTYVSLRRSLASLREICDEDEGIKKIGMPRIGCGLDRLQWTRVKKMLVEVFEAWDGEIVICSLSKDTSV